MKQLAGLEAAEAWSLVLHSPHHSRLSPTSWGQVAVAVSHPVALWFCWHRLIWLTVCLAPAGMWVCRQSKDHIPHGAHPYYFPEGSHSSGHLLSMRIKDQGVLTAVNIYRYQGIFGRYLLPSWSHTVGHTELWVTTVTESRSVRFSLPGIFSTYPSPACSFQVVAQGMVNSTPWLCTLFPRTSVWEWRR